VKGLFRQIAHTESAQKTKITEIKCASSKIWGIPVGVIQQNKCPATRHANLPQALDRTQKKK
jgi:hypothetical protein